MIDFRKNSRSLLVVWSVVLVFFALFIVYPLFCVLLTAGPQDYARVASSQIWRQAMKNTFLECICSSFLSVFTGFVFAYAVVKGNIPFRRFFSVIPIIHLITPPFVGGLAFILLVGRQGFITHRLLGLDVSLYGFPGLLIAQTLCFFPMAYLICVQTLSGINRNVEQAARSLGAGNLKIFFSVTLPLCAPGILSSFLFVAVNVLSDFGNPLIVAGRFRVLAVEIYTQLTGWLNVGTSAVLGIILVVPSVVFFIIQNRMLKKVSLKLSSIGGKGGDAGFQVDSENCCGRVATVLLTIFVSFVSLCVISQLLSIVAGSFQKLWGINYTFTLDHIKTIGRYSKGLRNSLMFALLSSVLSTVLAVFTSYMVHRAHVPLRKTLDALAQLPSAIPGSLLGLAISIGASRLHFRCSSFLIVIAMTVAFLPFSYRIISQTFAQVRTTLDDGAQILGANKLKTLLTILVPIGIDGIFSGFIYDFIRGVGTLSAVIFLVSFNTPLTSISIINLAEQGDWGKSAALALVLTIITFLILGVGYGITRAAKRFVRI